MEFTGPLGILQAIAERRRIRPQHSNCGSGVRRVPSGRAWLTAVRKAPEVKAVIMASLFS
jgi:hypothetical protein